MMSAEYKIKKNKLYKYEQRKGCNLPTSALVGAGSAGLTYHTTSAVIPLFKGLSYLSPGGLIVGFAFTLGFAVARYYRRWKKKRTNFNKNNLEKIVEDIGAENTFDGYFSSNKTYKPYMGSEYFKTQKKKFSKKIQDKPEKTQKYFKEVEKNLKKYSKNEN